MSHRNRGEEEKNTERLRTDPIPPLLKYYAVPAIVGTTVNSLYNVVDRIFIGQGVNSLAISGLAVTFPIFIFLQAFGMMIGAGASTQVSILLGRRERARGEELLGNAFMLSVIFSIVSITLALLFMKPLLLAFGASEVTLPYAVEYLSIALPGNIFANICFTYNNVMRASGYPRKAMTTMLIGALLNTVLDPIFIFVFGMGIRGAAVATVISMFVGMSYVLAHFMRRDSLLRILPRNFKLKKKHIVAIISIGLSPFLIQLTASFVSVVINRSLYYYGGDYAVGAYGILNSFALFIVMVMMGFSQGMQPIVGFNYGAGQFARMREAFRLTARYNVLVGFAGSLVAFFLPEYVVRLFTSDPEMVRVAAPALRIVLCIMWGVGFQITVTQFFQSIGHAKKAILLSLSRQIIFLIPMLLILPPIFRLNGVWMASPVADVAALVLSVVVLMRNRKKLYMEESEPSRA